MAHRSLVLLKSIQERQVTITSKDAIASSAEDSVVPVS